MLDIPDYIQVLDFQSIFIMQSPCSIFERNRECGLPHLKKRCFYYRNSFIILYVKYLNCFLYECPLLYKKLY